MRKKGMSYSQIKTELDIPKSTLSNWLHEYPLSRERINELRARSEQRIEKFRLAFQLKRERRLTAFLEEAKKKMFPLSLREMLVGGLFLYWGEGSKTGWGMAGVTNTDPRVLKFFCFWLTTFCQIKKSQMRVRLQLYKDMDQSREIHFWSHTLGIRSRQFVKPQIKNTKVSRINYKGTFGHGTCTVIVYKVPLKERIMMQIKAIAEHSWASSSVG